MGKPTAELLYGYEASYSTLRTSDDSSEFIACLKIFQRLCRHLPEKKREYIDQPVAPVINDAMTRTAGFVLRAAHSMLSTRAESEVAASQQGKMIAANNSSVRQGFSNVHTILNRVVRQHAGSAATRIDRSACCGKQTVASCMVRVISVQIGVRNWAISCRSPSS